MKKIPAAPFLGRDMAVVVDSEFASDAKDLTPAQRKISLGKLTVLQFCDDFRVHIHTARPGIRHAPAIRFRLTIMRLVREPIKPFEA